MSLEAMPRRGSHGSGTWWFWTILGFVALCWLGLVVVSTPHARSLGYDFSTTIWRPAGDVIHGRPMYPANSTANVPHTVTVNPPLIAVLSTPLRLLPYSVALGVFDALAFAACGLAFWIAGVRDWRVYAIALGSAPVVSGLIFGQVTGLLALGYALVWRYRDRTRIVGPLVGLLIALKLLAWPLVIWLALTRRVGSAVIAACVSAGLILVSWTAIGYQGFTSFPRLLRLSADAWAPSSYSVKAVALASGLSSSASEILGFILAGLLCSWAIRTAVGGRDFASFAAATAAGIYFSPVVHLHYAIWIVVLVALAQPGGTWMWLLVLCYWISPTEPARSTWQLTFELVLSLALVGFAIAPRSPERVAPQTPAEVASA